jgi:hypothetical protein
MTTAQGAVHAMYLVAKVTTYLLPTSRRGSASFANLMEPGGHALGLGASHHRILPWTRASCRMTILSLQRSDGPRFDTLCPKINLPTKPTVFWSIATHTSHTPLLTKQVLVDLRTSFRAAQPLRSRIPCRGLREGKQVCTR